MWNQSSRLAIPEDQDGRPGVVGGVEPATVGQRVGVHEEPGRFKSQFGGHSHQVKNRWELEVQQGRQVVTAPDKTMLQVLQRLVGKTHRQDRRSGKVARSPARPVQQITRDGNGILTGLGKRLLRDKCVGNPASPANQPLDGQLEPSKVLLVAAVPVKNAPPAVRTLQFPSDLRESSCPVLPSWR